MTALTNEEWRRFYIEEMTYEDPDTGCWLWTGELGNRGNPTWVSERGNKINIRHWLWSPFETDKPESTRAVEGGTLVPYPIYHNTRQCRNWKRCIRREHLHVHRWGMRHVPSDSQ